MAGRPPAAAPTDPPADCPICPRLVEYRRANRAAFPRWHNAPVPGFGDRRGRLLIVGLAPGLRGANRSGRPFTGDYAGDLLFRALAEFGFARGAYRAPRDDEPWPHDDLGLTDARITNAVRCVPPENKPLPAELRHCRPFLAAEIAVMPRLAVVLALGRVAHEAALRTLGARPGHHPFAHGALHRLSAPPLILADSFHCSRYNTNTGRLTEAMFMAVFAEIRTLLDA